VQAIVKEVFGIDPPKAASEEVTERVGAGGGKAVFVGKPDVSKLSAIFSKLDIVPDVEFEGNPQPSGSDGVFSFVHKIKDGKDIYFFANSSDDEVSTYARVRGRIKPELWDPYTGEMVNLKDVRYIREHGKIYTRFPLKLDPVRSVFIVTKNQ